jgi:hypothetical protein
MKYRLVPTNPIEEQVLQSGAIPLPVWDTLLPLVQARAIMAGVRLGIFEAIGRSTCSAEKVAERLALETECLNFVLRVLVCADYLERVGDQYRLTSLARKQLLRDSPQPLAGFVEFAYLQWEWIEGLENAVQTGEGVDAHATMGPPENWEVYQRAMSELARSLAKDVAPLVPIKNGAETILDIGGAHGLYGAMICRLHPGLRSEVLDLPEAVEHGRRLAREMKIDDVVTHRAGNALEGQLGSDLDAVFVADTIHHFTRAENVDLFQRACDALSSGGTVSIWDFERPGDDDDPELAGDALALYFRVTSTAQAYTAADYSDFLESAGFSVVRATRPPFAPGHVLVTGEAP